MEKTRDPSAYNAGDPCLIPGWGRSPGEGNGNTLYYSCLENSMDRGAQWATVHGVAKSRTQLIDPASKQASYRATWAYTMMYEYQFQYKYFNCEDKLKLFLKNKQSHELILTGQLQNTAPCENLSL